MKTFKFLLGVCFVCFSLSSIKALSISKDSDTLAGLELKGRIVKTTGSASEPCRVELFLNGRMIDSLNVAPNRPFNFRLQRNNVYTVRITKKDHISKLVVVNTEFPDEILDLMEFSFKTDLLPQEKAEELNKDALDFPAAIVHFEPKHEIFVYNETYTKDIKREIYSQPGPKHRMLASD